MNQMQYKELIVPFLKKEEYMINGEKLRKKCKYCSEWENEDGLIWEQSLKTGDYKCQNCSSSGNLFQFIKDLSKLEDKEIDDIINTFYSLEMYENETNIPIEQLKKYGLRFYNNKVLIPYYDQDMHEIAIKELSKNDERWSKSSKTNLYGLWQLKDFTDNSYIFLTLGEKETQVLWNNDIQALGMPKGINLKEDFNDICKKFDKIFIPSDLSLACSSFVRQARNILDNDEIFEVYPNKIDESCNNVIDLNLKGKLSLDKLLNTSKRVEDNKKSNLDLEKCAEHVIIAEKIMQKYHIHYFHEDFYVYDNGVYNPNKSLIEKEIININPNAKKNLQNEVLNYIRIQSIRETPDIDENLVNYKNCLFDISKGIAIPHSPDYFTINQNNANYINDNDLHRNEDIENFLNSVTCNNQIRKQGLLEVSGNCQTYKVPNRATFLYRTNSQKW